MRNVLTIDVEEYFQVHAFESVIRRSNWDLFPNRVMGNTVRILELLAHYDVQATFFILGWVADRYPELVQMIAEDGHEIASHGYWHELVYRQTPEDFAADLRLSLDAISAALPGVPIAGYRAPSFSITAQSLWALDVLDHLGLVYDSSIFPLSIHDRYGIKEANRFASKTRRGLWEIPVSTIRLGKRNWPIAGGGYFRLYPLWVTRQAMHYINGQGQPAVIYLHPWEFDPHQPRIAEASWLSRFRHYVNIDKTEDRLRLLLQEFEFGPIRDVFAPLLKTQQKQYQLAN